MASIARAPGIRSRTPGSLPPKLLASSSSLPCAPQLLCLATQGSWSTWAWQSPGRPRSWAAWTLPTPGSLARML
eukprot:7107721-Alexandrium_andersonii.AAC.1